MTHTVDPDQMPFSAASDLGLDTLSVQILRVNKGIVKCCFLLMLYMWVKISADNSLNYFSYFLQKVGFDIESRL